MTTIAPEPVSAHVYRLAAPSCTLPPADHTNVYAVVGAAAALVVDAGYKDDAALAAGLAALAGLNLPPVMALVLTHHHPDHVQGAGRIAAALRAPIWAHALTAARLCGQVSVQRCLAGGEQLCLGGPQVHILHAPGHTRGQLNLYIPDDGVVLAADNLAGAGTTAIIPPDGTLVEYLASLRHLLTLDLKAVGPGHGRILCRPGRRIRAILTHRQMREGQIVRALGQGPAGVAELTQRVYADTVPARAIGAAQQTLTAHLIKLQDEGRVAQSGGVYRLL